MIRGRISPELLRKHKGPMIKGEGFSKRDSTVVISDSAGDNVHASAERGRAVHVAAGYARLCGRMDLEIDLLGGLPLEVYDTEKARQYNESCFV